MQTPDKKVESTEKAILSRIGKPVVFKYPGEETSCEGILKDRAVLLSSTETAEVLYWDVVDLIEFAGTTEPQWLRVGYYRQPGERLVWGSQTTLTEPLGVWKKLLVHTARQKPWFRHMLDEVMAELNSIDEGQPAETSSEA